MISHIFLVILSVDHPSSKVNGIAEGRIETKIETAKKLLENKVDISIICDSTGLSKKRNKRIRKMI